jgi:hypothetical protein
MAQVIQDTPDDPIGYIIKVLQGIHKKQSKQLDNSLVSLCELICGLYRNSLLVSISYHLQMYVSNYD